jgi:hypothetical protein
MFQELQFAGTEIFSKHRQFPVAKIVFVSTRAKIISLESKSQTKLVMVKNSAKY